jgi:hypothetical protein
MEGIEKNVEWEGRLLKPAPAPPLTRKSASFELPCTSAGSTEVVSPPRLAFEANTCGVVL